MLDADSRERYLRHILLKEVGAQGQHKLRAARVLIVGAGGLGGPILQYLAAAGVGALGVIDDDSVALSNLQRQTIFTTKDIGEAKVARAAAFANALNPGVRVIAQKEKLTAENAADHLAEFDIIVEGVDNFDARFALNTACIKARKPLVSAAIGRFEGHLSVFKPWAGAGLPCYRCLVPEAPPRDEQVNCAEEGVLGPLAGVIGSMAALETLKEILSIGDTLAGRLFVYDGLGAAARCVKLPRDPECADCSAIERDGSG
ncbi:MAG: molybdopterin-synthase adenylyltransferase MoeB [Parvularculaceae bacterium]|nr:molybdopterin-synthase adenylyltransferase MoeB [Parvularculaceae bacterium]